MKVKLHSKIKHQILGYYYGVLRNVLKSFYSYYYVDLFSGDGKCSTEVPDHIIKFLPDDFKYEWDPPYTRLFEYAKDCSKLSLKCIFNDLNKENIIRLKDYLKPDNEYVLEIENKDANLYYKRVIELIEKPNRPSLFYLDPTNHADLKFSTIKGIAQFENPKDKRKPELIINLMAYSMLKALQRNSPEDINGITESLGTDAWKKKKEEYQRKHKTHELFRDTFLNQLNKLGYKTTHYCIKSVKHKSPQYYLIFATYNDKIFSIHKQIAKKVQNLQKEEWVKRTTNVSSMIEKICIGQTQLNF